jgi:hypothetical protein
MFWEYRILRYPEPNRLIFAASIFGLDFFHLGPLVLFSSSPCLKITWIFKFSSLTHFLVLPWNCENRMVRKRKSDNFSRLTKFDHQRMTHPVLCLHYFTHAAKESIPIRSVPKTKCFYITVLHIMIMGCSHYWCQVAKPDQRSNIIHFDVENVLYSKRWKKIQTLTICIYNYLKSKCRKRK